MKRSLILTATLLGALSPFSFTKPLKVFIVAGQSNMEEPASISTFDYIGDDPATAPLLKKMRTADGKPTVAEGTWISYLTGAEGNNFELHGKLTAGYGSMWGQEPTKQEHNPLSSLSAPVQRDIKALPPKANSSQKNALIQIASGDRHR